MYPTGVPPRFLIEQAVQAGAIHSMLVASIIQKSTHAGRDPQATLRELKTNRPDLFRREPKHVKVIRSKPRY